MYMKLWLVKLVERTKKLEVQLRSANHWIQLMGALITRSWAYNLSSKMRGTI